MQRLNGLRSSDDDEDEVLSSFIVLWLKSGDLCSIAGAVVFFHIASFKSCSGKKVAVGCLWLWSFCLATRHVYKLDLTTAAELGERQYNKPVADLQLRANQQVALMRY